MESDIVLTSLEKIPKKRKDTKNRTKERVKGNRSSIAIYSTEQQKEYRQGQDEAQKLTEGTEVTLTERGKR